MSNDILVIKKKNQQEILNMSHAFVLVFFKDFWNLLKKRKKIQKSLMLTETTSKSKY